MYLGLTKKSVAMFSGPQGSFSYILLIYSERVSLRMFLVIIYSNLFLITSARVEIFLAVLCKFQPNSLMLGLGFKF
jgi:hypothetical protein